MMMDKVCERNDFCSKDKEHFKTLWEFIYLSSSTDHLFNTTLDFGGCLI